MTSTTPKTILVTGSAGFIGFHVAHALLEQGATVIGIDNFNDYYTPTLKEDRNAILETYPNFTLCRGDLADTAFVNILFKTHSFESVCHLAAQPGVRYSLENPGAYITANIVAFTNVLEAARHHSITNLVYASSSSVYGGNQKTPFSITDPTDSPVSLYAATKKSNELMAHTYHHLYGINTTGLRFFTVIGPYGRPDMAPMLFADAIVAGTPIRVFNHGKMQRDFTYIDDIVSGVLAALETQGGNRIFNLGNNQPVPLEDFITYIETALGRTAIRQYEDMQPGDIPRTYADITETTTALHWQPTTPIEESVSRFIAWYKDYHQVT